jgi:hypothetical protein
MFFGFNFSGLRGLRVLQNFRNQPCHTSKEAELYVDFKTINLPLSQNAPCTRFFNLTEKMQKVVNFHIFLKNLRKKI